MSAPTNQPPSPPGSGPIAGTAVEDTAGRPGRGADQAANAPRSPWERPSSATTSSLPVVGGAEDPYLDRNGRAANGSPAAPAVGSRPAGGSTPAQAAHRPPAPNAVDQYAALGLAGAKTGQSTAPVLSPGLGGPAVQVPGAGPYPIAAGPAGTATATGVTTVTPAAGPTPAGGPAVARPARRGRGERTPRRARLQLRHFNVWTVFKFSIVLAVALFFVWMIIVAVLYGMLDQLKVIDKINKTVQTIENNSDTKDAVTPRIIFTSAFLIGLVNIVLFIVLTTIGSVVYNLCADLVGGIEVTLAERD